MKLVLEIEMNNDAFVDFNGDEASRILGGLSCRLHQQIEVGDEYVLMDRNGNKVGTAEVLNS